MTLKELVYKIWRRLSNGDVIDDSRFTYREIKGYAVSGIADALKRNFYENLNASDFRYGDDSVTTTYTGIQVQTEQSTQLQYIELPAKQVSIGSMRGVDVHDENPLSNFSTTYIPIRNEEVFVGSLQPDIPCVVQFYQKGSKLYFKGFVDADTLSVTQKYAIPTDDNAEVSLPPEFENMVVAGVLEILAPKLANADRDSNGIDNNI